ncbi:MAG: RNA methyltransferase [Bacteroidota bacterium]|nr:RNA methyltransferase [Bacteroidota bacterium]
MIPKRVTKFIKSLQIKKYRKQHNTFFVEGAKSVVELLESDYEVTTLIGTPVFLKENNFLLKNSKFEVFETDEAELSSLGNFKTNNACLATARTKPNEIQKINDGELVLGLDDVRDPGNLGTIIRVADWYGVKKIICSINCAEFYNPKVISATMGSFTRVKLFYTDLLGFVKHCQYPVYGAFLDGENVHNIPLNGPGGFIIMGNESSGINKELENFVGTKILIPQFGGAESLNVSIATAIICDNFRRKEAGG